MKPYTYPRGTLRAFDSCQICRRIQSYPAYAWWPGVVKLWENNVFNIKLGRMDTNKIETHTRLFIKHHIQSCTKACRLHIRVVCLNASYRSWIDIPVYFHSFQLCKHLMYFDDRSQAMKRLSLTGVFPFDVGQVGRARVAAGQILLGQITVHVHEVGIHGDLRGHGRGVKQRSFLLLSGFIHMLTSGFPPWLFHDFSMNFLGFFHDFSKKN